MVSLGIDLGGTQMKCGLVEDGKVLRFGVCDTCVKEGYAAVTERMAKLAEHVLEGDKAMYVGIASPGIIDTRRGIVRYSNNFDWHDAALGQDMSKRLGLPVGIANDAQCAALGEALYGAGKGIARMAMVTIGTGVGGGFVRDGRLETDSYGSMAYIFGHAVVAHGGRACNCGRKGCLEAYASATAMAAQGRLFWEEEKSVKEIFRAAGAGDEKAQRIIEEFLEYLTEGAVNIANILRPRIIVVGGGVSASADRILPAVNRGLQEGVYGYAYAPVRAVRACLGNQAGIVGAASLMCEEHGKEQIYHERDEFR